MTNESVQYKMPLFSGLLGKASLLKDEDARVEDKQLEVLVRSGDYFVMLASKLDALGRDIEDYGTRLQIESMVSDLIYLQDNYSIQKKEK